MAELSRNVKARANNRTRILVVEDDAAVSKLIKTYLDREGYSVSVVGTVADMRNAIERSQIDLILLDVGLPDEDGWSALRWVRARGPTPVMMLTGKGDAIDKVIGLELGADDYLAKPFDMRELLARLHNIEHRIERSPALPTALATEEHLTFPGWTLDLASQQLRSESGRPEHLTQAEYRILVLLVRNARQVVTRDQLMVVAAGRGWEPLDRSIDVHISNLRRKLDPDPNLPSLVRTVRGAGYMFVPNRG